MAGRTFSSPHLLSTIFHPLLFLIRLHSATKSSPPLAFHRLHRLYRHKIFILSRPHPITPSRPPLSLHSLQLTPATQNFVFIPLILPLSPAHRQPCISLHPTTSTQNSSFAPSSCLFFCLTANLAFHYVPIRSHKNHHSRPDSPVLPSLSCRHPAIDFPATVRPICAVCAIWRQNHYKMRRDAPFPERLLNFSFPCILCIFTPAESGL